MEESFEKGFCKAFKTNMREYDELSSCRRKLRNPILTVRVTIPGNPHDISELVSNWKQCGESMRCGALSFERNRITRTLVGRCFSEACRLGWQRRQHRIPLRHHRHSPEGILSQNYIHKVLGRGTRGCTLGCTVQGTRKGV